MLLLKLIGRILKSHVAIIKLTPFFRRSFPTFCVTKDEKAISNVQNEILIIVKSVFLRTTMTLTSCVEDNLHICDSTYIFTVDKACTDDLLTYT